MSQLDGDDDRIEHTEMNKLPAPEFKTYEEEAATKMLQENIFPKTINTPYLEKNCGKSGSSDVN